MQSAFDEGEPGGGGVVRRSARMPSDVAAAPDALSGFVVAQRTANDRLRQTLLQPLQASVEGRPADKPPSLAVRTRVHRLRRVLDVHTDTLNLEDEVCRIWRTNAGDSTREFVRRRALDSIEKVRIPRGRFRNISTFHTKVIEQVYEPFLTIRQSSHHLGCAYGIDLYIQDPKRLPANSTTSRY